MKELDLGEMFAEGAKMAASEHGMSEKDAEAFAESMCKEAKKRIKVVDDDEDEDDDDENGTWWGRNKGWLIPTGVGLGAFLLGSEAGKYRPDRSPFSNAAGLMYDRIKALLGAPGTLLRTLSHADKDRFLAAQNAHPNEAEKGTADSVKYPAFNSLLNGRMPVSGLDKKLGPWPVAKDDLGVDDYKSTGQ